MTTNAEMKALLENAFLAGVRASHPDTFLAVGDLRFAFRDAIARQKGRVIVLGAGKALAVLAVITVIAVPLSPRVAKAVKPTLSGRVLGKVVVETRALFPERIPDTFAATDAPSESTAKAEPPSPSPQRRPTQPSAHGQRGPSQPPANGQPTARPPAPPARRPQPPAVDPDLHRAPNEPPRRAFPQDETGGEDHVERDLTGDPFDTTADPTDPLAPPRK